MSWYSDKERFDEYDDDYCLGCSGGDSYESCQICMERHRLEEYGEVEEEEEEDE